MSVIALTALPANVQARAQDTSSYRSANQGYSFSYPSTWHQVPGDIEHSAGQAVERVLIEAPDGALAFVSVVQLSRPVRPAEIPDLQSELDSVMLRIAAEARGEIIATRLVKGEGFGKENAFYYHVNFPRGGVTIQSRQYILFAGNRQFIMAIEADAEGQANHDGVLDLMYSSFEIQER